MKARVALSWIALVAGGAYGAHLFYTGQAGSDPLVSALHYGYGAWSLFWGAPVVLRWWWGLHFGAEFGSRLFKLALGFILVPILSLLYGALGGGIYQLWKHS